MSNQNRFAEAVLPALFEVLDAAFPEFGWRRRRGGWVATNEAFTHERFDARAERVICREPRGYYIHGSSVSEHWLSYINNGQFPSGAAWARAASELARLAGQTGFTTAPAASIWDKLMAAARQQMTLAGAHSTREYCRGRSIPAHEWGLGTIVDLDLLLRSCGLSVGEARARRILTSRPGEEWWSGRLVGPVFDRSGAAIGLWGRAIGETGDKYVVTGRPGPSVHGSSRGREVVVCEGYLDALRVHSVTGLTAVAAGGIGVEDELLAELHGASEIFWAHDPDDAGERGRRTATKRLATWSGPPSSFVVGLAAGQDINEALQEGGSERWESLRLSSQPWLTYAVTRELDGKTARGEVEALRRVGALCRHALCSWPIEVAVALREVGKSRALDERFLMMILRE